MRHAAPLSPSFTLSALLLLLHCVRAHAPSPSAHLPRCTAVGGGQRWDGHWALKGAVKEKAVRAYCPHTLAEALLPHPAGQPAYFCPSYTRSLFRPGRCTVPPTSTSLAALEHCLGKPSVTLFVGDSLAQQAAFGLQCELERAGGNASRAVHVARSLSMRADLDKEMACKMHAANSSCARCEGGTRAPTQLRNASAWRQAWMDALPEGTTSVVLNTGAWYSPFHLCGGDAEAEFDTTLSLLLPFLAELSSKKRKLHVLWQDIPPMPPTGSRPEFAWAAMKGRNARARAALAAAAPAVTFLETSKALRGLRKANPGMTVGGVHWCSPGPDSATPLWRGICCTRRRGAAAAPIPLSPSPCVSRAPALPGPPLVRRCAIRTLRSPLRSLFTGWPRAYPDESPTLWVQRGRSRFVPVRTLLAPLTEPPPGACRHGQLTAWRTPAAAAEREAVLRLRAEVR